MKMQDNDKRENVRSGTGDVRRETWEVKREKWKENPYLTSDFSRFTLEVIETMHKTASKIAAQKCFLHLIFAA